MIRQVLGARIGVGTTEQDVWGDASARAFPQVADTFLIASGGNAADAAAGAGAREVTVEYLDVDWQTRTVAIATAGASASAATLVSAIRVNRAWVSKSGAYGAPNTGTIVIQRENGSNETLAVISAGMGVSNQSHFTVPEGFQATFVGGRVQVASAQAANVRFWARRNADVFAAPFEARELLDRVDGLSFVLAELAAQGLTFPARTDLWWSGVATASTTNVIARYQLDLTRA